MRALVISDTHFGAWTGDDLLRREPALRLLAGYLDDIDEIVILGDLFDFLFASIEEAFQAAEGFFELLAQKMQGKRVVFLAGNHDHHIMLRELETLVERSLATGQGKDQVGPQLRHSNYFSQFLKRRLPGVETEIVYPTYRLGNALMFHGHYLDAHVEGSLANRMLRRATWGIAGGMPSQQPTVADYEAVITPLTELLYSVAQLPRGAMAQQNVYSQLENLGKLLRLVSAPGREIHRATARLVEEIRAVATAPRRGRVARRPGHIASLDRRNAAGLELARVVRPNEPTSEALQAYAEVVGNLGWDADCDAMIFAHTHQPLDGVRASENDRLRFWNTGCWIYEPTVGSVDDYMHYLEYAWPGTAVLVDTEAEQPQLIEILAEHNPLNTKPQTAPERRVLWERARQAGPHTPGPLGETDREQPDTSSQPAGRAVASMVRRRRLRGIATLAVGATAIADLFGGLFSSVVTKVHQIALFLPLGVAEGTRSLLFVIALLLLLVTRGLWQGNRRAWSAALALLALSTLLHLVRQGDAVGTAVSIASIILFAALANSFRVPARSLPPGIPLFALLCVATAVLVYGLVGWTAVSGHLPPTGLGGRIETILRGAFLLNPGIHGLDGTGRTFLASLGFVGAGAVVVLVALALGGFGVKPIMGQRPAIADFLARFGRESTAPLIGLPNNQVLELVDGRAVLGLKVSAGVAVAIGGPVGEPGTESRALEEFVQRCEVYGWTPALLGVSAQTAEDAQALGFEKLKISEEAVIELDDFDLGLAQQSELANAVARARQEGVEVIHYSGSQRSAERDAQLGEISSRWLRVRGGPELGLAMERFDPDELPFTRLYAAVFGGRIIAFVSWLCYRGGDAFVLDLMRRRPDSPPGTMELLVSECLDAFRSEGVSTVSLGGVAIAGKSERQGTAERSLGFVFEYGSALYEARGLSAFKQRFQPNWQPQYLLYPTALDLPRIALAVRRAYRHHVPERLTNTTPDEVGLPGVEDTTPSPSEATGPSNT
jgi:phosphatidylglycerol lysyltransferase